MVKIIHYKTNNMKKELATQYNNVAEEFNNVIGEMNAKSVEDFTKAITPLLDQTRTAIDFGCGLGDIISLLQSKDIVCSGVDSSIEMVRLANQSVDADIRNEDFSKTTFENESFDLITSKWAMQTSEEIEPIYREAYRLLRTRGYLAFLTVHPIRQFLEKKTVGKDYFKKEIVHSIIFDGAITVQEPSHTMSEYLSPYFLEHFVIKAIHEGAEFPAAEQVGGDIYPTYLIIVAQKK